MTYLRPKIRPSWSQDKPEIYRSRNFKAPSSVWVQHQLYRIWHRVRCRLFQKVIESKRLWVLQATSQILYVRVGLKLMTTQGKGSQ